MPTPDGEDDVTYSAPPAHASIRRAAPTEHEYRAIDWAVLFEDLRGLAVGCFIVMLYMLVAVTLTLPFLIGGALAYQTIAAAREDAAGDPTPCRTVYGGTCRGVLIPCGYWEATLVRPEGARRVIHLAPSAETNGTESDGPLCGLSQSCCVAHAVTTVDDDTVDFVNGSNSNATIVVRGPWCAVDGGSGHNASTAKQKANMADSMPLSASVVDADRESLLAASGGNGLASSTSTAGALVAPLWVAPAMGDLLWHVFAQGDGLTWARSTALPCCASLFDAVSPTSFWLLCVQGVVGVTASVLLNIADSHPKVGRWRVAMVVRVTMLWKLVCCCWCWRRRRRDDISGALQQSKGRGGGNYAAIAAAEAASPPPTTTSMPEDDDDVFLDDHFEQLAVAVEREAAAVRQLPFSKRCFRMSALLGLKSLAQLLVGIAALVAIEWRPPTGSGAGKHHGSTPASAGRPNDPGLSTFERYTLYTLVVFNASIAKAYVNVVSMWMMIGAHDLSVIFDEQLLAAKTCTRKLRVAFGFVKTNIVLGIACLVAPFFMAGDMLPVPLRWLRDLFVETNLRFGDTAYAEVIRRFYQNDGIPTPVVVFGMLALLVMTPAFCTHWLPGAIIYFPWTLGMVACAYVGSITVFLVMTALTLKWRVRRHRVPTVTDAVLDDRTTVVMLSTANDGTRESGDEAARAAAPPEEVHRVRSFAIAVFELVRQGGFVVALNVICAYILSMAPNYAALLYGTSPDPSTPVANSAMSPYLADARGYTGIAFDEIALRSTVCNIVRDVATSELADAIVRMV